MNEVLEELESIDVESIPEARRRFRPASKMKTFWLMWISEKLVYELEQINHSWRSFSLLYLMKMSKTFPSRFIQLGWGFGSRKRTAASIVRSSWKSHALRCVEGLLQLHTKERDHSQSGGGYPIHHCVCQLSCHYLLSSVWCRTRRTACRRHSHQRTLKFHCQSTIFMFQICGGGFITPQAPLSPRLWGNLQLFSACILNSTKSLQDLSDRRTVLYSSLRGLRRSSLAPDSRKKVQLRKVGRNAGQPVAYSRHKLCHRTSV